MAKKPSKSAARRQKEQLDKSRKARLAAIDQLPRAPPGSGPVGLGINLLKRAPESFVDAADIAFNQRLLLDAAVLLEDMAMRQERVSAGVIAKKTLLSQRRPSLAEVDDALAIIEASEFASPTTAKPRKVTKKMRAQRKIQSKAFKNANAKGRKQNGEFRAGFDQARIARMAQKECSRERIRLGLCDDPKMKKKKGTKKGQVRKTARRAFE